MANDEPQLPPLLLPVGLAWLNLFPPRTVDEFDVPDLHHYTTADGLKGIVQTNCLWASRAKYSNDLSEVAYAYAIARQVLSEKVADATKKGEAFKDLFDFTQRHVVDAEQPFYDGYILSFCENGDLLSQWRAYGLSSGFAVTFSNLSRGGKPQLTAKGAIQVMLRRIDYDIESQRKTFGTILDAGMVLLSEFLPKKFVPEPRAGCVCGDDDADGGQPVGLCGKGQGVWRRTRMENYRTPENDSWVIRYCV